MEEEFEDDVMLMEPDVMEPDVKPKTRPRDPEEKPFDPDRDRRERNPDRLPYTDPDTHPQGRDKDFDGDSALEKLVMKYLRDKGLKFNAYMFEFGNNFIFNDSIKITDPLEFYEKAKKNNLAINHHVNDNCDFIAIMDSDLFFSEEQYDMVYDHIVELENSKNKIFFTYNLMDIHENERKEILELEKIELNKEKLEELKPKYSWRHSWGAGVLGGIFIVPRKEIS